MGALKLLNQLLACNNALFVHASESILHQPLVDMSMESGGERVFVTTLRNFLQIWSQEHPVWAASDHIPDFTSVLDCCKVIQESLVRSDNEPPANLLIELRTAKLKLDSLVAQHPDNEELQEI